MFVYHQRVTEHMSLRGAHGGPRGRGRDHAVPYSVQTWSTQRGGIPSFNRSVQMRQTGNYEVHFNEIASSCVCTFLAIAPGAPTPTPPSPLSLQSTHVYAPSSPPAPNSRPLSSTPLPPLRTPARLGRYEKVSVHGHVNLPRTLVPKPQLAAGAGHIPPWRASLLLHRRHRHLKPAKAWRRTTARPTPAGNLPFSQNLRPRPWRRRP